MGSAKGWMARALKTRLGLVRRTTTRVSLGERTLEAVGFIPRTDDYDDAWNFLLSAEATQVVDLGANKGQASLLMAIHGSVERVLLVDANPRALALAAENMIRNGFAEKSVFACTFCGETDDDEIDLYTVGAGAAGSRFPGHAVTAGRAGASISVRTTTLDTLCERMGMEPSYVKIDVEGAESDVLAGAGRVIDALRPRVLVEMHSPPERPMAENAARVLSQAAERGYAAWYLATGERLETPAPMAHRGRCHLLLQPEADPLPSVLRGVAQGTPVRDVLDRVR